MVVKYTTGIHQGHLLIVGSVGSAPRSYDASLSAHLSEDGRQNSSESWYPAKSQLLPKGSSEPRAPV